MDKLVSIIVPVYNAGAFIEETIQKVCDQTYGQWELLLVDDCSKDDSREKIQKYCEKDERIRLIAKEKNEGAAKARNTGIELAGGSYLAFLDADDIWYPDKLEKELQFMEEKQAAFAFTSYEFGDEEGYETGRIVDAPATLDYRKALSRTVIFTSTVMFDLGKIDRNLIKMPDVPSEDTATWWSILKKGYTAYGLDEILVVYRRPEGSLSADKIKAIRRIWNLYRNVEGLTRMASIRYFIGWAVRASARRI